MLSLQTHVTAPGFMWVLGNVNLRSRILQPAFYHGDISPAFSWLFTKNVHPM